MPTHRFDLRNNGVFICGLYFLCEPSTWPKPARAVTVGHCWIYAQRADCRAGRRCRDMARGVSRIQLDGLRCCARRLTPRLAHAGGGGHSRQHGRRRRADCHPQRPHTLGHGAGRALRGASQPRAKWRYRKAERALGAKSTERALYVELQLAAVSSGRVGEGWLPSVRTRRRAAVALTRRRACRRSLCTCRSGRYIGSQRRCLRPGRPRPWRHGGALRGQARCAL